MNVTHRNCLRCSKSFPSAGRGNRICADCNDVNKTLSHRHGYECGMKMNKMKRASR